MVNVNCMNRLKKYASLLRKTTFIVILLIVGILSFSFIKNDTQDYFEIAKNLDIFASLYRELNTYYVDDIEPAKIMRSGIEAMLKNLDPYTNFISEAEIEDYRFLTTGQYGGIGALISKKDDYVIISEPYEECPAQKADLRAGDMIISIDGISAKGKNVEEVSKILKGQPNTVIKIIIRREGVEKDIEKNLTRDHIKVKNVPYYGMYNDHIGYIKLTGFTQNAGNEVRSALIELKKNEKLKSVVLDVRYNPGGLLNEAVNVSNVFIENGKEVVSTRGKVSEWDKVHKTNSSPVDAQIPVAVLANGSSASASEIVSGVIQDYDRGVVVGQKTYGKGLVQSTRPLSYNTQLKVTTAKYYVPSGRCIQAIDYSDKNEDGSVGVVADSLLNEFKTTNGRKVFDGGGITPDASVERPIPSNIAISLEVKRVIFDYATLYRSKHDSIISPKDFKISDDLWNDFKNYIKGVDYDYTTKSEVALEDFKKQTEKEDYFKAIKTEYEELSKKMIHNKEADIEKYKDEIKDLLKREIVGRYYYRSGSIEASFSFDTDLLKAAEILSDINKYNQILQKPVVAAENDKVK